MGARPDRKLVPEVLALHLEEVAFLLGEREAAHASAAYTLPEITDGPERRLLAHAEALALGGPAAARRVLLPALGGEDPDLRAAAVLGLLGGEAEGPDVVAAAFSTADPEGRAVLSRSLRVGPGPAPDGLLEPFARAGDPALAAAAVEVLAFRRAVPAALLPALVAHDDPALAAAALRAQRLSPGDVRQEAVTFHLGARQPERREAALVAGLVAGRPGALRACRSLAGATGQDGRLARLALCLGGAPHDAEEVARCLEDPALRRDALFALGFSGRPAAAAACLPWLEDEEVGPVAAEAFSAITGLAIEGRYRRPGPPEGGPDAPLPPLEEDLARDLAPGPDDDLPLAAAGPVAAWWEQAAPRLDPGARLLGGAPHDLPALLQALEGGPARRRGPLALELAIRSRGAVQVEPTALAAAQVRQLQGARALRGGGAFTRPFAAWMS